MFSQQKTLTRKSIRQALKFYELRKSGELQFYNKYLSKGLWRFEYRAKDPDNIYYDGTKQWSKNGIIHRDHGPSIFSSIPMNDPESIFKLREEDRAK